VGTDNKKDIVRRTEMDMTHLMKSASMFDGCLCIGLKCSIDVLIDASDNGNNFTCIHWSNEAEQSMHQKLLTVMSFRKT
jgi:hypothetical protein